MSNSKRPTLYRLPKGKIAGVCAGIADYFHIEVWLLRVVAVAIFLLGGWGIVSVVYVVLWMILDVKPSNIEAKKKDTIEIKNKIWQSGEPAGIALREVNGQLASLEFRLQDLEKHIISDSFDLKRQINQL